MKAGWTEKPISQCFKVKSGDFLPAKAMATDGNIYVYGGNGITGKHNAKNLTGENIIIGRVGAYCGNVRHVCGDAWVTDNAFYISEYFSKFDYGYLATLLEYKQLRNTANQAAQPVVSYTTIKDVLLQYPPLPEQQRIAGILDEAFDGIATAKANAEKNLQNAHALFDSHLQSVFTQQGVGWVEKRLEQIGSTQTGSTPKSSEQGNYGEFIPFIKPADFNKDGSLDYENDGLSEQGFKTARKIAADSVLMVCIGATIGKCGWCDRDVTSNQQINAFTPIDGVSNKFIYYQMLTEDFQKRVLHSSGQATLPIINKSKWSSLSVTLPPQYAEQERIVDQFDKLIGETQHLESIYKQKISALDALKKSLLDKAFTGEL